VLCSSVSCFKAPFAWRRREMRHQGAGQLLGRVVESEAIETLAATGGLLALVAAIEVSLALPVLATGAAPISLPLLLAAWLAVTLGLARRYLRERGGWSVARLEMTHDLVERMVGHRTRLAQQSPDRWHAGEAEALTDYLRRSRALDRSLVWLAALTPRGWLLAAVAVLAVHVVAGDASTDALAVSLGGTLLAFRALNVLVAGLSQLAGAVIAWQQVAPLIRAAERPERLGSPHLAGVGSQLIAAGRRSAERDPSATTGRDRAVRPNDAPLLVARGLRFRHPGREDLVLRGCDLDVRAGDRLLLEGASGTGKSTLASLLVGLRLPQDGSLRLAGHTPDELGSRAWRMLIAASPQFHENHVFLGSLAFNLLLGRRWPPRPHDLHLAGEVCGELGLGPLLERMPSGLEQIVGETGWQLSHGERSLVFIGRSLLADAQLIVLDESFGALDPATLQRALHCVLARDTAVLVIAH
jgi:ATP-binding cassette subfamily B protein